MSNIFIAPCTTTLNDYQQEKDCICPYNARHKIKASSMQKHLIKCRLETPCKTRAVCPYNEAHVMPVVELELHKISCPGRFSHLESKSSLQPRSESLSVIPIKTRELPKSEDWDEKACATYDPSIRLESGNLRIKPKVSRLETNTKAVAPFSLNCRLGPPVLLRKDDVGSQEVAAKPRHSSFDSNARPSSRYGHETAKGFQDQAGNNYREMRSQKVQHTSDQQSDGPNSTFARSNQAFRNQSMDVKSCNPKRKEQEFYVPPPRLAEAQAGKSHAKDSCQYEVSHRESENHSSAPRFKPKSRSRPRHLED